ncbi:MAG: helix-turn-helix domain-containing protein [Salibacteraceae bacterium]
MNAKGVTIHSQFLLPLGSFVPVSDAQGSISNSGGFFTKNTLTRKHTLNKVRKQVLHEIDLLIIDEVSMLRADILDAIDFRLRQAKQNFNQPFGGVQLLLIGDLFQLPPIVRDHEWHELRKFYPSIWFFESIALKESGFVYLELDKIFRQRDDDFIRILNNLRNNNPTPQDIELLNSKVLSGDDQKKLKGVITLTTHNKKATEINLSELKKLKGKSKTYTAEVSGDFPESMYPVAEEIELKVGAQVMFIKNDTKNQAYFNGKLAEVCAVKSNSISVLMDGSEEPFELKKEVWENVKYELDESSKELEEEVVGQFEQYPIRLAWAITVHKSQGLTFDRAIIDVGRAFAPGQVYVALSRLRSLDGLMLLTPIDKNVVSSDANIVNFSMVKDTQPPLEKQLDSGKRAYIEQLLITTFNLQSLIDALHSLNKKGSEARVEFDDEDMRSALDKIRGSLEPEVKNTQVFTAQLLRLNREGDKDKFAQRLSQGAEYYKNLFGEILSKLLLHMEEVRQFSRTKMYIERLEELDAMVSKKNFELHAVKDRVERILNDQDLVRNEELRAKLNADREHLINTHRQLVSKSEKFTKLKSGKRRKGKSGQPAIKTSKGETYAITNRLLKEGLSLDEIAEKRGMAMSTIEGHAARLIADGEASIDQFMNKNESKAIAKAFAEDKVSTVTGVHKALKGAYSYGKIRMVKALLKKPS